MLEQKSDTSKKNASPTKNAATELNKSRKGLVKGPKPLQRLKFYLDVKNHAVTSKLEEKIKELGGAVEFFLDREVTHVISDRPQCADNLPATSPSTPRLRSVESNISNESPNSVCESPVKGKLRQKTRADAMLEKVRTQSANKVRDPLENAKLWGIPIWNVNKFLSWLEKVSATVNLSSSKKHSVKVINITAPFIKFEPLTRNARPVYKSIKSWPTIDLEAQPGKPAFIIKSNDTQTPEPSIVKSEKSVCKDNGKNSDELNESRMTRKQRTRLSVRKEQEIDKQALVGGYCEICHCEYREIAEHVRSEKHLNFIKNDANFLELDSLISAGANVEAFLSKWCKGNISSKQLIANRLNGTTGKDLNNYPLFCRRSLRKLNGKTSPEKCDNPIDGYSPPVTRNKMPRTRGSHQHLPLSPTGSDLNNSTITTTTTTTAHHLRSRGQILLPNNLIGTTAEDEPIVHNSKRSSSRSNRFTDDESKSTKENEEKTDKKIETTGRPKRTCPKTKRISADERLVADNKTYYKVEVMTTKLRSSGLGTREVELARRVQTPIPEEASEPEEQGLVVKFRRVRRSELSVLNDEAENFMFPRKEDPSFSDLDTDDGPNTTKSTGRIDSSDIKSSDMESSPVKLPKFKQDIDDDEHQYQHHQHHHHQHLQNHTDSGSDNESVLTRRKRKRNDTLKSVSDEHENNAIDSFASEIGLKRKRKRAYTETEDHTMDESSKDDSIMEENSVDSSGRKKRRRTHAEMFIADNQRYYKFETPGSRLRYQGMFFPQMMSKDETPSKNNGECHQLKMEPDDSQDSSDRKFSTKNLKFSFELPPTHEPWYQTFKRQDEGKVIYTCTSDPGYCTNFFLPYQLPFIIPLDPKKCIAEYQRKRQMLLKLSSENAASLDENSATGTEGSLSTDGFTDVQQNDSTSNSFPGDTDELPNKPHVGRRRRKRKSRFLKTGQPRKSPRQHASTLAILSSLIQQRKKRERKSHGESDTSRVSLPSIPEEDEQQALTEAARLVEEEKRVERKKNAEFQANLSTILNVPIDIDADDDLIVNNITLDGEERVDIKHNQDYIDLIENFDKEKSNLTPPLIRRRGRRGRYPRHLLLARLTNTIPLHASGVRKNMRRKRKKNRTGWPKKKRLMVNSSSNNNNNNSSGNSNNIIVNNNISSNSNNSGKQQKDNGEHKEQENNNNINEEENSAKLSEENKTHPETNDDDGEDEEDNDEGTMIAGDDEDDEEEEEEAETEVDAAGDNDVEQDEEENSGNIEEKLRDENEENKTKNSDKCASISSSGDVNDDNGSSRTTINNVKDNNIIVNNINSDSGDNNVTMVNNSVDTCKMDKKSQQGVKNCIEQQQQHQRLVNNSAVINNNSVNNVNKQTNSELQQHVIEDRNNGAMVVNNEAIISSNSSSNNISVVTKSSSTTATITNSNNNSMLKVSLSTDFASNNKVPEPPHSNTLYNVNILDYKQSVVDDKKMDPCTEADMKVDDDDIAATLTPTTVATAAVAAATTTTVAATVAAVEDDDTSLVTDLHHLQQYQPVVRVQKLQVDTATTTMVTDGTSRHTTPPPSERKQPKRRKTEVSPSPSRSPRRLRTPRGKWYRER